MNTRKIANDSKYSLPKWFYVAIGGLAGVVLWMYLVTSGWVNYASVFVQCGWKQPVYAYTDPTVFGPQSTMLYSLPGEEGYTVKHELDPFGYHKYYCTEEAAKKDGYKHLEV